MGATLRRQDRHRLGGRLGSLFLPAITPAPFTRAEAEDHTRRTTASLEQSRALIVEGYERDVHTALGYASWREYAVAELGYSESHAYRLLDHGRVLRALLAEGVSPAGETVTERQARELAPVLRREGPQAMATVWHARFTKRLEQATRELHSLAEDIKAATGLDREARELLREDVGSVGDAMDDVFRAASGDQR